MWCFQQYREGGSSLPPSEDNMGENGLQILEEAMERIWFHENILTSSIQLGLGTAVKKARSLQPPASTTQLVADSEDQSNDKSRYHSHRKKPPTRLKIITSNQLFQLPPSPLIRSRHQSSSPPPSTENSPQSRNTSRRPPTRMMRSYKSFSELEQDELKGFMDLGFEFHKESLSPRMMSVLPGLQRLGKKANELVKEEEGEATVKGKARRPYLAEAWLIKRPNSPLLNLKMLPAISTGGADMKKQIRFWARTVASTIHQES
ncbi:hypothetical protein Taro_012057 [Colocasia esculenta]|uniref:Uncharacterized protein n=1 Tax=Colocasia esculenta TaxID=4460 RepID=A0A843UCF5_COLES|nr:hypothetical protein [Colocasia esculenta]